MGKNRKRRILINQWLKHLKEMEKINKYLFEHTELFENKYMDEFNEKLFRYFAGKITFYTREYNKIVDIISPEEWEEMKIEEMRKDVM